MEALWKIVLLHIPQAFLFVYAGLGLVGARPLVRRFVPFIVALGIVTEILRTYVFPWHGVALVFLAAFGQRYYFRVGWGVSFTAVFLSYLLVNAGEFMLALVVFPLFSITLPGILESLTLFILAGWVAQLPLVIASVGVYKKGWVLFPLHIDSQSASESEQVSGRG